MADSFKILFRAMSNMIELIFNDKSISEIEKEELLSKPEARRAYKDAIDKLRNGQESADVILEGESIFKIRASS